MSSLLEHKTVPQLLFFLKWNYGCSFQLFGERERIEIRDKEANSQQNHVQGMESEVKWVQSRLGE